MLRGVEAVTDTALAHVEVEALIEALLIRIRDQLAVDTATVLLIDASGQELVATASIGRPRHAGTAAGGSATDSTERLSK
jgi:hypothetical protein